MRFVLDVALNFRILSQYFNVAPCI